MIMGVIPDQIELMLQCLDRLDLTVGPIGLQGCNVI